MMITLPRRLKQILCSIVLLLSFVSLVDAQQEATAPKTIQLFATEDNPSGRIAVDDDKTFRKRKVIFNPVFFKERDSIRNYDKLVGHLFDDIYVEGTVKHVLNRYNGIIYADIEGAKGAIEMYIRDKVISMRVLLANSNEEYRCYYDPEESRYIITEIESQRAKKAKTGVTTQMARPRTIQLFVRDDDPRYFKAWDMSADAYIEYVRKRNADINPLLFQDRIHEVQTGDFLVGQLFEDVYFEGEVIERLEGGHFQKLRLKIRGEERGSNRVELISGSGCIHLTIVDYTRRKMFFVGSRNLDRKHNGVEVVEFDPSEINHVKWDVDQELRDIRNEISKKEVATFHGNPISAYVFYRNAGGINNWGEVNRITTSRTDYYPAMSGRSVAIFGDDIIAGSFRDESTYRGIGAAYIFSLNKDGRDIWTLMDKLIASDAISRDRVGNSVAISGDSAVIGAYRYVDSSTLSSFGYVYYRIRDGRDYWIEVKKLIPSEFLRGGDPALSPSVDISGDYVILGTDGYALDKNTPHPAYLFYRHKGGANNWGEFKKLIASDSFSSDCFGSSVAIDGDYAIVGARNDRDYLRNSDDRNERRFSTGSAYVFYRNQGGVENWGEVKKLIGSGDVQEFGYSVDISGDFALVGARRERTSRGAAYIFYRNQGGANNWGMVKKLIASDNAERDFFGSAVAISGDYAIVGTQAVDGQRRYDYISSAYIYYRNQGGENNWGEVKKLTASDDFSRHFGMSVDIGGDYAIVSVKTLLTITN